MAFVAPTVLKGVIGAGQVGGAVVSKRRSDMCMTERQISRRDLGKLAVGACAAGLVSALTTNVPVASAQTKKSKPVFTKDDSGIQYYDVKEGNGSPPVEGDFVVVDYVSSLLSK